MQFGAGSCGTASREREVFCVLYQLDRNGSAD
jgi:hypothetical protein